ncbi:MAG: hypothetical protein COU85_01310, partial [Candidatus Portnoybacteria bacterium CG10_big_fil_rev_8_21_14_0_10_44_7]
KFSGNIPGASTEITLNLDAQDEGSYVFYMRGVNLVGDASEKFASSNALMVIPPPVPFKIGIYDDVFSTVESGGFDYDDVNNRSLSIRWEADPGQLPLDEVVDWHVYANGSYLGRTGNANATRLNWSKTNSLIHPSFRGGPAIYNQYQFSIFGIRPGKTNLGPFQSGAVTMLPAVIATDDASSFDDLSNGEDIDSSDNAALAVRWKLDASSLAGFGPEAIVNFHVYLEVNGQPRTFLGQTGNGIAESFEWTRDENNRFVKRTFRNGPQNGNSYKFAIYALTSEVNAAGKQIVIGPLECAGAVAYTLQP